MSRLLRSLFALALVGALAWGIVARLDEIEADENQERGTRPPAPVAVVPVERGTAVHRRTFSGALEASAEFLVAPKIAGRIARVLYELGDPIVRGAIVAELDDSELRQDVLLAEATLAEARASLASAERELQLAERRLTRLEALGQEGVASESQLDTSRVETLAARTAVDAAGARVKRGEAALETERIQLGYARVTADWTEGDDTRVVAERFVDEGVTVSSNARIALVAELDPLIAIVHAPERDYAKLAVGQAAQLTTDAYPGRVFEARVARIAPVFRRATRQARVELLVENHGELLKPGMFIRATIELDRVDDAVLVPFDALTKRGDQEGIFVLDAASERALWRPIELGIRDGDTIEVRGAHVDGIEGRVVVLGQELCDDGGPVTVPADDAPAR